MIDDGKIEKRPRDEAQERYRKEVTTLVRSAIHASEHALDQSPDVLRKELSRAVEYLLIAKSVPTPGESTRIKARLEAAKK